MSTPTLILAAALLFQGTGATPPPGRRVALPDEATLFIPEGFRPAENAGVDVLVHLHGVPGVIEPAFLGSKLPGVLVTFNRKGLSSVYTKPFSDPALLTRLTDSALKALKAPGAAKAPGLGRLVISSFSAGFGGVREILKVPEHFARVDGLIMADSIYCGYAGGPARHVVDPALMDGFRRFAVEAAAGRKTMLVTHSAQVPEGYASTTETADDLIAAAGAKSEPGRTDRGDGWVQTRRAAVGNFLVLGFEGTGPEDHMRHLRRIGESWTEFRGLESGTTRTPR